MDKTIFKTLLAAVILLSSSSVLAFWGNSDDGEDKEKSAVQVREVTLNDDGLVFKIKSEADTISGFLAEQNITIRENDNILPGKDARIYSRSRIIIQRAKKITISVDGKELEKYTYFEKTEDALADSGIVVSDVDIMHPSREALVHDDMKIDITRVNVEEKTVKKDIDYKTISKTDDELGWREKKVEQKGEEGIKEIKYEITYHNGKEISRKTLESSVIKEPITEIITRGTYVKLGKSHKGLGTWYAHTGTMAAASPWLLMGSYAKVTNKANGKSVIVKINDRGPFGKGRIIDLDKVAFIKIASIGAGVIDVKVEEILN